MAIIRNAARCKKCNTVIESKHRHDYVVCGCPANAMVDGGKDYLRWGWNGNMGTMSEIIEDLSEETEDI